MIAAIVLAAGRSSRMGKSKQTLQLRGMPLLQRVLVAFRQAKVDRVVVVLGAQASTVRKKVKFVDETVVVNRKYADGMSGSLRLGLAEVEGDADAVIISLGDQPFVAADTIGKLVEAHRSSGASVVLPVFRGQRGNPVLFDRSVFPQIKKIRGDVGAKSVVAKNEEGVLEVSVDDSGVIFDIDTPSDYSRAVCRMNATRLKKTREQA